MLKAFAIGEGPMDQHLEISVQMAQEVSSASPSSTSLPSHFEPTKKLNKLIVNTSSFHE